MLRQEGAEVAAEVVVACDRPCQFVIDPFLESRFASRFLSGLFAVRLDSSIPDAR